MTEAVLTPPGDKSVTQRALLLAALAEGESRLSGLLPGEDPAALAGVLRRLGVEVPTLPDDGSAVTVRGRGLRGLRAPDAPLDCANSGTAARLLLGVLAGQGFESVVTGDPSLRRRPMARVTDPLRVMGARFRFPDAPGRLPVEVRGGPLGPLEYRLPVASAQVKSALLLAGLVGGAAVRLVEPGPSRDHTERMLSALGCPVSRRPDPGAADAGEWRVELADPPAALEPLRLRVPGDFSSAAFPLAWALAGGGPRTLVLRGVGVNPTRTGLLRVLARMGAEVSLAEPTAPSGASGATGAADLAGAEGRGGEPVADLVARSGPLVGTEVGAEEIPTLIDEVPALVALAVRAEGETRIGGAAELRVKESDRIRLLVDGLRAVGVEVEEAEDGLALRGTDAPLRGEVRTGGDHRIAMAFGVLGRLPGCEVRVDDPGCVGVSYPSFWSDLDRLSAVGAR